MNNRVSAIIKDGKNNILLIHRIKNGQEYFVLPGGSIKANENKKVALLREIKEETNLDIKAGEKIFEFINPDLNRREIYFITKSYTGNLCLGEPEKSRQSIDNIYILEWKKIKNLNKLNFYPRELISVIQGNSDIEIE